MTAKPRGSVERVKSVTKAVIPAAGMGTRFLPATKSQPKEMLPVVDKPSIQYVVEEAVAAGLTDILIITGRGKRAIEDHFDRNFELEHYLEESKKFDLLAEVQEVNELADIHYIRQRDPLGLGHAVNVAREHVGDEPFVVILGDDIMVDDGELLRSMIEVHDREQASVLALLEVEPSEISSYGCAECDVVDDTLRRVRGVVEKPRPEDAQSNLAVIGRYVFSPGIFDALGSHHAGRGWRAAAHRRDQPAPRLRAGVRPGVRARPLRHRAQARLPPRQHRARARPRRSRPRARGVPPRAGAGTALVIPLGEVQDAVIGAIPRFDPVECDRADALGLVLAADVVAAGRGAAVRQHRDGRLRGACRRHRGCERRTRRSASGWWATCPAGHAPTIAVGRRRGDPHHDRRADARRCRRDRHRGAHPPRRRTPATATPSTCCSEAKPGDHVRRPGGDVEAGQLVFRAGTVLGPAHLGVLASIDVHKVSVFPRARVGVLSTGDELVESGPLTPGKIRDANRPMLLALVGSRRAVDAVDLGAARDDEAAMTAVLAQRDRVVRRRDHERRSVGGRLRLRQRRARAHRRRRSRRRVARRLVPGGDPAVEAAVRRARARHAGVRASGQPGVVTRELRAVRAAIAAAHDGPHRAVPARGRGDAPSTRCRAASTASCTSTACTCASTTTVTTSWPARGSQESNALAATAAANGLVLLPDGEGVDAGAAVRVMLLDQ